MNKTKSMLERNYTVGGSFYKEKNKYKYTLWLSRKEKNKEFRENKKRSTLIKVIKEGLSEQVTFKT